MGNHVPCFSSGNADLDRAFRLALDTLSVNTKQLKTGLLAEPRPCLTAGQDYPSPWTRDAAINVWFAEALLDPETARNTLLGVLEEGDGGPVVAGQYWDRIIWALGAERLWDLDRDPDFARFAYGVLCRTAEACLREEFDPEDGLFRGPAVYGDGVSAYPEKYRNPSLSSSILRWPGEHPEERVPAGAGIPDVSVIAEILLIVSEATVPTCASVSWNLPIANSLVSTVPEPGSMSWKWLNRMLRQARSRAEGEMPSPPKMRSIAESASASNILASEMRFDILILDCVV